MQISDLTQLSKTVYMPKMRTQINNEVVLLSRFKKRPKEEYNSVNKTFALEFSPGGGSGARPERGTPPTAGQIHARQGTLGIKYLTAYSELTKQAIELMKANEASYANVIVKEMTRVKNRFQLDVNRMLYADGRGELFKFNAADNATPLTAIDTHRQNYIQAGENFDVIDAGDFYTSHASAACLCGEASTKTSVAFTGGTVSGTADNDYAVTYGSCYTTSLLGYEFVGLEGIVNDSDPDMGSYAGLAVASYPYWKSQKLSASGTLREPTEDLVMQAQELITIAGGKPTAIYGHPSVIRRFFNNAFAGDRRYAAGATEKSYAGGFMRLGVGGVDFIADYMCPYETMFVLDESTFSIGEGLPLQWIDDDGAVWHRNTTYTATFGAEAHWWLCLICDARKFNCVIADLKQGI